MDKVIVEFLAGLVHGPCGSVGLDAYERWVRIEAERHLKTLADQNLCAAGLHQRTRELWWTGEYTGGRVPSAKETALMQPHEVRGVCLLYAEKKKEEVD